MTVSLDSGPAVPISEYTLTPAPVEYLRSLSAVMPDPRWSFTDAHGHEHRWARTDRKANHAPDALPTLTMSHKHIECDGSCPDGWCEGYSVPVWHCTACGDEVEPGFIPDYKARTTGIPFKTGVPTLTVKTEGDPLGAGASTFPDSRIFDAVVEMAGARMSGKAAISNVEWSSEGSAYEIHVSLDPRDSST